MKVKCPKCKRTDTYVTTDKYNPDIYPTGDMLTLRDPKHKGGMTYGTVKGSKAIHASMMECCDCGGMLVRGGKLTVIPDNVEKSKNYICSVCGRGFVTNQGLSVHVKRKHEGAENADNMDVKKDSADGA